MGQAFLYDAICNKVRLFLDASEHVGRNKMKTGVSETPAERQKNSVWFVVRELGT